MILEYSLAVFGIVILLIIIKPLLNWSKFKQDVSDNLLMIKAMNEQKRRNKK